MASEKRVRALDPKITKWATVRNSGVEYYPCFVQ